MRRWSKKSDQTNPDHLKVLEQTFNSSTKENSLKLVPSKICSVQKKLATSPNDMLKQMSAVKSKHNSISSNDYGVSSKNFLKPPIAQPSYMFRSDESL